MGGMRDSIGKREERLTGEEEEEGEGGGEGGGKGRGGGGDRRATVMKKKKSINSKGTWYWKDRGGSSGHSAGVSMKKT